MNDALSDLGKTIADLERKAGLLETENESLRVTNALQSERVNDLEKRVKKLDDDRDYYMQQNAQLHSLLNGAGSLIIEGLRKINLNDGRANAQRAMEAQLRAMNDPAGYGTGGLTSMERQAQSILGGIGALVGSPRSPEQRPDSNNSGGEHEPHQ